MAIIDDWDAPLGQQGEPERIPGDFKRDKRGTPYVSHPDGKVCASGARKGEVQWVRYGRPSSFGKEIENTYNLQRWNERQIAIGMTIEDHTLTDWLLKLADLDPESEEGKDAADAIVVQSKRLAKAGLAAERGTHMHAVTEDDDQESDWVKRCENGEILDLSHEVQEAMLEAWRLMCMAYDLEILDVERKVVHDGWHQAGTLDRRVRLRRDITFTNGVTLKAGKTVLLDLKTGKLNDTKGKSKLDQGYWHSYAVQCVTYADGVPYDCDTDTRGEWDEPMCSEWAVIAHLPVDEALEGKATCRLVLVDIAAARTVVEEVVLKAKAWQARRDLFAHTADEPTIEVDVVFPVERGVNHVWSNEPASPVPPPTTVLIRAGVIDEGGLMNDKQLAEIRQRATDLHPEAKAMLDMLAKQAAEHGYPFSIGAGPTLRRWHIYRALLRLAVHYEDDLRDEFIRATLALVLPDVEQPAVILGPAIGSLTVDEAQRFVQAAIQVIAQDAVLTIDDAGRPKWAGFDNPAA